jgi:hypothetical protein
VAGSAGEEFFAHGFHFGEGVLVGGAVGGGDAIVQAGERFVGAVERNQGLRGHLIGGDVVGIAVDAGSELGERGFGIAEGDMLHGETIAGEGVVGVEGEDFIEGGEFVHGLIVWAQWSEDLTPMDTDQDR